MKKSMDKDKASIFLFVGCFIVYTLISFTKSNYNASIAYTVSRGIFSKADSGMIVAAFYLLYGIGQFFGGGVVDRFSPYHTIAIGLLGSIIANTILCFTTQYIVVLIVWSLNGICQFGVWPGLVRIISETILEKHRRKASLYITFGLGGAGILSYICAVNVLERAGWVGMFIMNVVCSIVMLALWIFVEYKTKNVLAVEKVGKTVTAVPKGKGGFLRVIVSSGMIFAFVISVSQTMLDTGIKTWMPTMIVENYQISTVLAGMQTALLYAVNVAGVALVALVFGRIRNEMLIKGILFAICIPIFVVLLAIGKLPLAVVVAALIVATTLVYYMNNINVRIPVRFALSGHSGTVSGILNALSSFGIVIAGACYGIVADKSGWTSVITIWIILAAISVALSVPAAILWKRFIAGNAGKVKRAS